MNLVFRLFLLVSVIKFVRSQFDEYVDESRQQCSSKYNLISCAKYRTLEYLSSIGQEYGVIGNESSNSPIKIVKLDRYHEQAEMFPTARQLPGDSEITKFLKFAQRQANNYLGRQGIMFDLPEGAEVIEQTSTNEVEEGRRRKRRAAIVLMPIIMLFKLFNIQLMLAMALASLMFIKKAVLLAALAVPALFQQLKHCNNTPALNPINYAYQPEAVVNEESHGQEAYGEGYRNQYTGQYGGGFPTNNIERIYKMYYRKRKH